MASIQWQYFPEMKKVNSAKMLHETFVLFLQSFKWIPQWTHRFLPGHYPDLEGSIIISVNNKLKALKCITVNSTSHVICGNYRLSKDSIIYQCVHHLKGNNEIQLYKIIIINCLSFTDTKKIHIFFFWIWNLHVLHIDFETYTVQII